MWLAQPGFGNTRLVKPGYLSEIFVSFQGEGAHVGKRHLFVRLAGCHLRCVYCDTPDSLERTQELMLHSVLGSTRYPNPVAPTMVAKMVTALMEAEGPIDAISLTGGEPLNQSRFIVDLLSTANFAVPVLLETSGTLPKQLAEVLPYIDIVSMDLKLPSNTGEPPFWVEHAEFLRMSSSKDTYVKVLVDDTTSDEDLSRAFALLGSGPAVEVFLQPIMTAAGEVAVALSRLHQLHRMARALLPHVRMVPQTHKLLGAR